MLTEAQRHELVALLAAGHSRRAAARLVGCARSTIYRMEARDPEFAQRVARAEGPGESPQKKQDPRKIFPTLHQPANWRAAAWVLERLNPEDFGPPRNASNFDLLVEADIFRSFVELVRDEIPRDTCCLLVRQINQLLAQYDAPSIPQLDEPDPDPVRTGQENEEGGRGQVPAEIARLVATFDGKPFLVDTPEFLADRSASFSQLDVAPINWPELIESTTESAAETYAAVFDSPPQTDQTGRVGRAAPKNKRKRRRPVFHDAQLNPADDPASPTILHAEPSPWDDLIPSTTTSPAEIFAAVFASARPKTGQTDQTGRVGRADQTNNVEPHRAVPPDAPLNTADDQASPTSRSQDPAGLARILAALNPKPRQTALADSPLFPVVRSTRPTSRCPAKEPALRHPSSEPPTYVASPRPKALLLIGLAIFEKLNFFGHTRSRGARPTEGTAHGGKPTASIPHHTRGSGDPRNADGTAEGHGAIDIRRIRPGLGGAGHNNWPRGRQKLRTYGDVGHKSCPDWDRIPGQQAAFRHNYCQSRRELKSSYRAGCYCTVRLAWAVKACEPPLVAKEWVSNPQIFASAAYRKSGNYLPVCYWVAAAGVAPQLCSAQTPRRSRHVRGADGLRHRGVSRHLFSRLPATIGMVSTPGQTRPFRGFGPFQIVAQTGIGNDVPIQQQQAVDGRRKLLAVFRQRHPGRAQFRLDALRQLRADEH